MAINSKLSQEAALRQTTKLTPLQIQEIRILEYTTMELEQRIEKEVEENPGLDMGAESGDETNQQDDFNEEGADALDNDDFSLDDYISDDDIPDYRLYGNNSSPDDKHEDIPFSIGETFQEYLQGQLGLLKLSAEDQRVALYVIGNIDESGYLRREASALVDDLLFHANIDVTDEKMQELIQLIQHTFEPAGVCARDLQECLLLQLRRKHPTPSVLLAIEILEKRYKEFTSHHYAKIIDRLHITEEEMRAATAEITHLNPQPGNALSNDVYAETTIIPDFIVEVVDGQITIALNNGNVPELRVNREYNEILQNYQNQPSHSKQDKDAISFIKDRIDSARWFIDAIRQRNETLLRTMRAIVSIQREFFLEGDDMYLKPMILKDIADRTGYDVSTVSRVSNSKYVQTNGGIYPLKHFFSESMTNEQGEEVATRAIKNELAKIIEAEDKRNPLNDDELVEALREHGYVIARRTIAKYRKQLNVPVARLRKEI